MRHSFGMSRLILAAALCTGLSTPVWTDCPPAPDHDAALAALVEAARAAPDEMSGRTLSNQMWELWVDAPDDAAQEILDRGMRKRESYDLLGAVNDFTVLTEYCPNYAEGFNQRAFAYFLQQNYPAALTDLNRALELSPGHIAARSGRALTYMQLGELDQARADLRRALDDNPWLSERHLLSKGGPLAPKGEDI